MARTKGSKNKKKEVLKGEDINARYPNWENNKKDEVPPLPPKKSVDCGCGHEKEVHYGGQYGWCNSKGCSCQKFS